MESFRHYYKESFRNVVAVLRPSAVGNLNEWQAWMRQLLHAMPAKEVRFIVLEYQSHPILDNLAREESIRVHTEAMDLDLPGLLKELAKGTEPGPLSEFRVLFVTLGTEAAEGNIEAAEKTAEQALAIAKSQGWLQMQVVIHMSLGAAYLQLKENGSARKIYKKALKVAEKAVKQNDPIGPKLVIQCKFAEAAALFADGNYRTAADVYRTISPLAEAEKDYLLMIEGWRMAAYCHEVEKQYDKAIYYNQLAMDAGERMPEDQRAGSTLAFVGDSQLRVIGAAQKKRSLVKSKKDLPHESDVNDKMVALLGPDWQDLVTAATENLGVQGAAPS